MAKEPSHVLCSDQPPKVLVGGGGAEWEVDQRGEGMIGCSGVSVLTPQIRRQWNGLVN